MGPTRNAADNLRQYVLDWCAETRAHIQKIATEVEDMHIWSRFQPQIPDADNEEVLANMMLAFRHLEDAKMRIGKVIQAIEGTSIYDTPANK